ncbi:MAG: patatin family protein, partial [Lachnospiraceae bacterium]|nr:patatin family protein [Lachnospiraceae bacterium]
KQMKKEKTGLVLEGGGVRGAYTAGALSWLAEQGINFDYNVAISAGAVYLAVHLSGETKMGHEMSTGFAVAPENVGVKALLRCRHLVDGDTIFNYYLKEKTGFRTKKLRESDLQMEMGLYDLKKGRTVYFNNHDLDDDMTLLRACCSLPIASEIVDFHGRKLLDGGITKMIPVERALEQGCKKCLIITTKPASYKRKPASKFVLFLMSLAYRKYPSVKRDYRVRHLNYYKQIGLVDRLVKEKKALHIFPSSSIKVSRFKGDPERCQQLYDLGYQDMQSRKQEILEFLKG